jgi:hypothetical protein
MAFSGREEDGGAAEKSQLIGRPPRGASVGPIVLVCVALATVAILPGYYERTMCSSEQFYLGYIEQLLQFVAPLIVGWRRESFHPIRHFAASPEAGTLGKAV